IREEIFGSISVKLDIDDMDFAGPETITVSNLIPGVYHYCVHDYTDRDSPGSFGITQSRARVQVFLGSQQVGSFAPPGKPGTVWHVFDVDNTQQLPQIVPLGQMSDESDEFNVCG